MGSSSAAPVQMHLVINSQVDLSSLGTSQSSDGIRVGGCRRAVQDTGKSHDWARAWPVTRPRDASASCLAADRPVRQCTGVHHGATHPWISPFGSLRFTTLLRVPAPQVDRPRRNVPLYMLHCGPDRPGRGGGLKVRSAARGTARHRVLTSRGSKPCIVIVWGDAPSTWSIFSWRSLRLVRLSVANSCRPNIHLGMARQASRPNRQFVRPPNAPKSGTRFTPFLHTLSSRRTGNPKKTTEHQLNAATTSVAFLWTQPDKWSSGRAIATQLLTTPHSMARSD